MPGITKETLQAIGRRLAEIPREHRGGMEWRVGPSTLAFFARITQVHDDGWHSWQLVRWDDEEDDHFGDHPANVTGNENAMALGGGDATVGDLVRLHRVGSDDGQPVYVFDLPAPQPSIIQFAKVVSLHLGNGNAWTDYPTDGAWPSYAVCNPSNVIGTEVDTETSLQISMNNPASGGMGTGIISSVGHVLAYIPTSEIGNRDGVAMLGFGTRLDYTRAL